MEMTATGERFAPLIHNTGIATLTMCLISLDSVKRMAASIRSKGSGESLMLIWHQYKHRKLNESAHAIKRSGLSK